MPRTQRLKHQNNFNHCLERVTKKSGTNHDYFKNAFSRKISPTYGQSVAGGSTSTNVLRMQGKRYKKERADFIQVIKKLAEESRQRQLVKNSSLPIIGCQNGRLKIAPSEGNGDWWREQE